MIFFSQFERIAESKKRKVWEGWGKVIKIMGTGPGGEVK